MTDIPATNLTMLTLVTADGTLELSLERRLMPEPKPHEVLVKVLATPINPSDLGLIVGGADMSTARASVRDGLPVITADVPPPGMRAMAGRVGEALPIGNEGCGVVVKAGDSPEAQALMGKTVALIGGEIYAEYRCLPAGMCMALPDGTDPKDGASCFVNPLTSLAFTEVMKADGYVGIVHAAAASNLGQMLVKICAKDGIPLVNIVRNDEQVVLLKGIGATHVLNSSEDGFLSALTDAITETGAFLGFDPIGGGKTAGQMLGCMEAAAVRRMTAAAALRLAPGKAGARRDASLAFFACSARRSRTVATACLNTAFRCVSGMVSSASTNAVTTARVPRGAGFVPMAMTSLLLCTSVNEERAAPSGTNAIVTYICRTGAPLPAAGQEWSFCGLARSRGVCCCF